MGQTPVTRRLMRFLEINALISREIRRQPGEQGPRRRSHIATHYRQVPSHSPATLQHKQHVNLSSPSEHSGRDVIHWSIGLQCWLQDVALCHRHQDVLVQEFHRHSPTSQWRSPVFWSWRCPDCRNGKWISANVPTVQWRAVVNAVMNLHVSQKSVHYLNGHQLLKDVDLDYVSCHVDSQVHSNVSEKTASIFNAEHGHNMFLRNLLVYTAL
jgi:hypothetical protein